MKKDDIDLSDLLKATTKQILNDAHMDLAESHPDPYAMWAKRIATMLSDNLLDELVLLLDGDGEDRFFHRLNEINAKRNPGSYAEPYSED